MPGAFVSEVQKPLIARSQTNDGTVEVFGSKMRQWAGVIILTYVLLGATCFYFIEKEHLKHWADALYFIVLTLTTVGYGDIVPISDGGKMFIVGYIFFGLSFIAACFGLLASKVSSKVESKMPLDERTLKHRFSELLMPLAIVSINMSAATLVVHYNEDMDWVTAVYWSMVSLTSVGYGDPLIVEESTRIFLIFFLLWGVTSVAWALGKIAGVFQEIEEDRQLFHFVEHGATKTLIKAMDKDQSGSVTEQEFVQQMLIKLNRISQADIDELVTIFAIFDRDGSGCITEADIALERESFLAGKNA